MELISKIRQAGFNVILESGKIRLEYVRQGEPSVEAKALLDALRERKGEAVAYLKGAMPKPCLEADGGLIIPFGSDSRYHWWKGGQLPSETEKELKSWKH